MARTSQFTANLSRSYSRIEIELDAEDNETHALAARYIERRTVTVNGNDMVVTVRDDPVEVNLFNMTEVNAFKAFINSLTRSPKVTQGN